MELLPGAGFATGGMKADAVAVIAGGCAVAFGVAAVVAGAGAGAEAGEAEGEEGEEGVVRV